MGYYSHVTGRIEITPPLRWVDVQASDFVNDPWMRTGKEVAYEIKEAIEDTGEGVITRRHAVAIVASNEETAKFYELDRHLADAVREVLRAGSRVSGHLIRSGESQGDVERLRATNDHNEPVISERAALYWPDGTRVVDQ
jgi:hypothetical protein